jgi:lysophospholipase L1-like esterase
MSGRMDAMSTPSRSIVSALLLSASSLVLALLVAEIALRLAGYDSGMPGPASGDPTLVFAPMTRDPLPPGRPADGGVFRVAAVGDSFTWGPGVEPDRAWPHVLEGLLGARAHRPATVANLGVSGYNACQEDRFVETSVIALRPDLVVLQVGWNDGERLPYNPPLCGLCLPDLDAAGCVVEWLTLDSRVGRIVTRGLRALRGRVLPPPDTRGTDPYVLGGVDFMSAYWSAGAPFRRSFEASIGRLVGRLRDAGIPVAAVWFPPRPASSSPRADLGVHGGRDWICEAAEATFASLGVPFLDLHAVLDPSRDASLRLGPSDEHMNADGNRLVADAIAAFLVDHGLVPAP